MYTHRIWAYYAVGVLDCTIDATVFLFIYNYVAILSYKVYGFFYVQRIRISRNRT